MKHLLFILACLIVSVVFTLNAGAQGMQGMGMMHGKSHGEMGGAHMLNMDTDKDGKVSREEWNKYNNDIFTSTDTNKDGFIDDKEMQAYHQSMMNDMMGARK